MKTKTALSLTILLIFLATCSAFAQNNQYSGEWKLNTEKTVLGDSQLFLSAIKVLIRNDSLLTTRTYQNGNGEEYPFEENLSLDGKDCKITIYDMPRSSKASRSATDGTLIIESVTTFNANGGQEDFATKETWKIDDGGKTLTIASNSKIAGQEIPGTWYYTRVK
jgi:hypothetical protein